MNDLKGKKLLILAGQDVHKKVVETAKDMGIYTIVTDYLEDSPCKKIADESLMLSITDVDAIVRYCKENNVDGIINFCNDIASKTVQKVNKIMGWPNIGTWEQVLMLTDKSKFKQVCIENGVGVIDEYTESDIESSKIEFPVFVKPVDSRGSRGSSVCYSQNELLTAIKIAKDNSLTDSCIIERYISDLQEVEITYIIIDGTPYLISLGDRYCGNKKDRTDKISSCFVQPSWFINDYLENVDEKVKQMLINIGLKNCAVFLQGFIDGNTIRFFDPSIRFPGNEYERVFAKATGVNPMNSMISYALTGKMNDFNGRYDGSYNLSGKTAVQYMVNVRPGKICEYEGIEAIKNHPDFVYIGEKYNIGDIVEATDDTGRRVFDISFLVDREAEAINSVIELVNDNIKVFDENNEDMVVSKFYFKCVKQRYNY